MAKYFLEKTSADVNIKKDVRKSLVHVHVHYVLFMYKCIHVWCIFPVVKPLPSSDSSLSFE